MERLRRVVLVVAAVFPALHVMMLVAALPYILGSAVPDRTSPGAIQALSLLAGLGILGVATAALPARAIARPTAWRGAALIAAAVLYAALIAGAILDLWGAASGPGAVLQGVAVWLTVALGLFLALSLGLIPSPLVFAGLYVAALLLGGALTLWAARDGA